MTSPSSPAIPIPLQLRRLLLLPQRLWQRLPLMDRWLTSELIGPLLFGVAAFTVVSLSVGVVSRKCRGFFL